MVLLLLGLSALFFRFVAAVIVDDSSDLIIYSNAFGWETGSSSQPTTVIRSPGSSYEGTWHEALSHETYFKFTFTGTSIAVYGIVPKYQQTLIGFAIDGGTETRVNFPATEPPVSGPSLAEADFNYRVQVFSNGGLSAGSHTIVMTCYLQSCIFGLDYVEYTAADVAATTATTGTQSLSQTTSGTNTQTTSVTTSSATNLSATHSLPPISISIGNSGTTDDLPTILPSDSRIVYQPQQWTSNTSCGLSSMVTTVSGSSFSFNFTGPSIWIYTATTPQGGKYGVYVNGTNMGFINTAGPTCKVEASYHVENLNNFMHTLVVTNVDGDFNFLGLRLPSFVDQGTGSSTTLQGAPNTDAIAGGVIGGAAVLALLIFGIYLCLRRQRRNEISRPETPIGEQRPPVVVREELYVIPLSEEQHIIVAEREAELGDPIIAYRSFRKPVPPGMALSPSYEGHGDNENFTTSYYTESLREQEILATHSSTPPSFRTRPITAQYQYWQAVDNAHSSECHKMLNSALGDRSRPFRYSLGKGGDPQGSSTSREEAQQPWPASNTPPYVDEVLARPNLSEAAVDMIARRLAEVMSAQNTAKGGPGLLRERTAPPRELLDQLVGEHLSAREDKN